MTAKEHFDEMIAKMTYEERETLIDGLLPPSLRRHASAPTTAFRLPVPEPGTPIKM